MSGTRGATLSSTSALLACALMWLGSALGGLTRPLLGLQAEHIDQVAVLQRLHECPVLRQCSGRRSARSGLISHSRSTTREQRERRESRGKEREGPAEWTGLTTESARDDQPSMSQPRQSQSSTLAAARVTLAPSLPPPSAPRSSCSLTLLCNRPLASVSGQEKSIEKTSGYKSKRNLHQQAS